MNNFIEKLKNSKVGSLGFWIGLLSGLLVCFLGWIVSLLATLFFIKKDDYNNVKGVLSGFGIALSLLIFVVIVGVILTPSAPKAPVNVAHQENVQSSATPIANVSRETPAAQNNANIANDGISQTEEEPKLNNEGKKLKLLPSPNKSNESENAKKDKASETQETKPHDNSERAHHENKAPKVPANSAPKSKTASVSNNQSAASYSCDYVINEKSRKFHRTSCSQVYKIKNSRSYYGTSEDLINQGYKPCKRCL